MSFKKSMVALAALTYGVGSVAATAAPVAQAYQPVVSESQFSGSSDDGSKSGTFLLVFAVVAIIAGIVIAADGGDDEPLSP